MTPNTLKKRLLSPLTTFKRIPPILWASAPGWTVVSTLLLILEIILGLATLYLIKTLVDAITTQLSDLNSDLNSGISETTQAITDTMATSSSLTAYEPILWQVGLFGAATLGYLAVRSLSSLAREAQGLAVVDHLERKIHQAAVNADLAFFESPKYFDTLERARFSGTQRPAQVASNALMLIKNTLMLTAVIALMVSIDWRLLPILAIAIGPALWVRVHFTQVLYQWRKRRTETERIAGYLQFLITSDVHAKELRLNLLGEYLSDAYAKLKSEIRAEQLGITQKRTWVEMAVALTASAVFFLALGYLTIQTAQGQNTVGDLVLFLLIFQRAQSMGQEIVNQISKLYEDHLYLGLLFEFLDLKPNLIRLETASGNMDASVSPSDQSIDHLTHSFESNTDSLAQDRPPQGHWTQPPLIEVEGVGFNYPGCQAKVLEGIDLVIRPRQVVALVGANGSGKTSLIKLLTRLYDPSAGRILVNGQDIRCFDLSEYRRLFSVVLQDFFSYADSVNNNIRFGDIMLPADSESLRRAADRAGATEFIDALPKGFETKLGRMFTDGVELSRGQWQKIALARASVDRAKIIILDEPSSALDPHAEAELFENFKERLDGRSGVIIAHRLSTIRMADWIYVLHEGRIVEEGTHDSLHELGGFYAQAFKRQARFYAS